MKKAWTMLLAALMICLCCLSLTAIAEELAEEIIPADEPVREEPAPEMPEPAVTAPEAAEVPEIPEADIPEVEIANEEEAVETQTADAEEPEQAEEPELPAEDPLPDPEEPDEIDPDPEEVPAEEATAEEAEEPAEPELPDEQGEPLPELKLGETARVRFDAETAVAEFRLILTEDMDLTLQAAELPVTLTLFSRATEEKQEFTSVFEDGKWLPLEAQASLRKGEYTLAVAKISPDGTGTCLLTVGMTEEEIIPEEIIPEEIAADEETLEIDDYETPLGLEPEEIRVTVTAACGEDETVILTAVITGCDPGQVTIDWQYSPDGGETICTVADAHDRTYAYTMDDENRGYLWRAVVTRPTEAE